MHTMRYVSPRPLPLASRPFRRDAFLHGLTPPPHQAVTEADLGFCSICEGGVAAQQGSGPAEGDGAVRLGTAGVRMGVSTDVRGGGDRPLAKG